MAGLGPAGEYLCPQFPGGLDRWGPLNVFIICVGSEGASHHHDRDQVVGSIFSNKILYYVIVLYLKIPYVYVSLLEQTLL